MRIPLARFYRPLFLLGGLLLAGCGTPTPPPPPTATPTLTLTPTVTPTATPTPTPTPVPPIVVSLDWPAAPSALEPFAIEVDVVPPPGVPADPVVRADLFTPTGERYAEFTFYPRTLPRYVSQEEVRLPLFPPEGEWRLELHVASELEVEGDVQFAFAPPPVAFRDLTTVLPDGVALQVPEAFVELEAVGDSRAGGRIWGYGDERLELWWAPGPAKTLEFDTAVVMLETTHDSLNPPQVATVEALPVREQPTFAFAEIWSGRQAGEAEAWVSQGPSRWLYVLRTRAARAQPLSPLLREVAATFDFPSDD